MTDRVKTGIIGLDKMLYGGIPEKNIVLLSGGPGTGKSLLCSHFIKYGADNNEPGVYLSMEEEVDQVISNMAKFGINMKSPNIELEKIQLYNFDALKETVRGLVEKVGATRLVIDPVTCIGLFFERTIEIRRSLVEFSSMLKKFGVTALLAAEIPSASIQRGAISTYGVEEFVTDGIIVLREIEKEGSRMKAIEILKMRGTEHEHTTCPFEISKKGFTVYQDQRIF